MTRKLHAAALVLCLSLGVPGAARAGETPDTLVATPTPAESLAAPAANPVSTSLTSTTLPNGRMAIGSRRVRLIGASQNVVRSGPGAGFAIVGVYPRDASFPVLAKRDNWYGIRLSDTETGWIHASLCRELDDLSGLEFRPNPKVYSRTGSYVLGGYSGAYAFDRKSNSLVVGGRLGYYVFDRIQAEMGVSWTHVRRPQEVVEHLFDLSLEAESFPMLFYQLDVLWEILPGRQMVPFLVGGAGSSLFLGRSEPSVNFGAGTLLFLSKRNAMRWEVRDYRLNSGSDAARLAANNIEFTLGTTVLF